MPEQRQQILQHEYESKDDQDSHLSALISYQNIQQRRPRMDRNNGDCSFQHDLTYSYKVRVNS